MFSIKTNEALTRFANQKIEDYNKYLADLDIKRSNGVDSLRHFLSWTCVDFLKVTTEASLASSILKLVENYSFEEIKFTLTDDYIKSRVEVISRSTLHSSNLHEDLTRAFYQEVVSLMHR